MPQIVRLDAPPPQQRRRGGVPPLDAGRPAVDWTGHQPAVDWTGHQYPAVSELGPIDYTHEGRDRLTGMSRDRTMPAMPGKTQRYE